jgi:hypothetical protein
MEWKKQEVCQAEKLLRAAVQESRTKLISAARRGFDRTP